MVDVGLRVGSRTFNIRELNTREIMVSFLNPPVYVEDDDIITKLLGWNVTPLKPIYRKYYPGTEIADGTRFLKVRFSKEAASLPYSAKFELENVTHYCRVVHSRQVKVCRLCMSPDHIMRDCPLFVCRDCCEQGHYARNCKAMRCPDCKKVMMRCMCGGEDEGDGSDLDEGGNGPGASVVVRKKKRLKISGCK